MSRKRSEWFVRSHGAAAPLTWTVESRATGAQVGQNGELIRLGGTAFADKLSAILECGRLNEAAQIEAKRKGERS